MSNEWDDEPDRKHWVDPETGLDCLIHRGPLGALCGYVGVPSGHPWYGVDYNNIEFDLEVHGGLTYSAKCMGDICHGADRGDAVACHDVWWLGFDCAHYQDLIPKVPKFNGRHSKDQMYRNIAYVENECRHLALQVAGAANAANAKPSTRSGRVRATLQGD